jgi:hypothetical protein
MAARKRRKGAAAKAIVAAAKAIRAKKLDFEREASRILSETLGFEVTVKIKRQSVARTPDERRFARKTRRELQEQITDAFAPLDSKL